MHWTLPPGNANSICYHLIFENSSKLPRTWWPFFMGEMHIYISFHSKSKTLSSLQAPHNLSEWFHQSWLVSGGITLYHFFFIPSTKFKTLKFGLRHEMHIKTCKKMFWTKKYHVKMHWDLAQGKCKLNEDLIIIKTLKILSNFHAPDDLFHFFSIWNIKQTIKQIKLASTW